MKKANNIKKVTDNALWRRWIIVMVVWLLVDGTIRKITPGNPPSILLIKDVLILCAYVAFLLNRLPFDRNRYEYFEKPAAFDLFTMLLIFICLYGSLIGTSFNPGLIVLGWRSYFFYVPLILLGYYYFSSPQEMRRSFYWLLMLSWPIAAVALLEISIRGLGIPMPRGLGLIETHGAFHTSIYGDMFYSASLFDVPERMGSTSLFLYLIGLGLLSGEQGRRKFFAIGATVAAMLCILASCRRTPIFLSMIGSLLMGPHLMKNLKYRNVLTILLLCSGIVCLNYYYSEPLNFALSTPQQELRDRIEGEGDIDWLLSLKEGTWGAGFSQSQGSQYFIGEYEFGLLKPLGYEGWHEGLLFKVILEIGAFGAFLYFTWLIYILYILFYTYHNMKDKTIGGLTLSLYLSILLTFVWALKGHQIFGDGHTLFRLWFGAGIILGVRRFSTTKIWNLRAERLSTREKLRIEIP